MWKDRKERKKKPKQTRQESHGKSDITGHPGHIECQRTNDRAAIRTAVIRQKGPFFVVVNEKDNRIMTGHCNQDKIEKISAQGQHRIARTGYPGQDNRTAPLGQDVQLKHSGKK